MSTQTHVTKHDKEVRPIIDVHSLLFVGIGLFVLLALAIVAFVVATRYHEQPYWLAGSVGIISIVVSMIGIGGFIGGAIFFSEAGARERERGADTILRAQESDDKRDLMEDQVWVDLVKNLNSAQERSYRQGLEDARRALGNNSQPQLPDFTEGVFTEVE